MSNDEATCTKKHQLFLQASSNGVTPLHVAAELGHDEIVEMLLDAGEDKNAVTKVKQYFFLLGAISVTPLIWFVLRFCR